MSRLLLRWGVITLAVWVTTAIVPGIHYNSVKSLLVAALVLGILNAFAKPILLLAALPVVVLSLGLFVVIINAGLLLLTCKVVPGFHVHGFWDAVFGAVIISLVTLLFGVKPRGSIQFNQRRAPRPPPPPPPSSRRGPPPGNGPVIDV